MPKLPFYKQHGFSRAELKNGLLRNVRRDVTHIVENDRTLCGIDMLPILSNPNHKWEKAWSSATCDRCIDLNRENRA